MFLPTGAYLREYHKSGALSTPPEADQKAIQAFIDAANSLLPEATREAAALKLQEMRFEVHNTTSLSQPVYLRSEREVRDILLGSPFCAAMIKADSLYCPTRSFCLPVTYRLSNNTSQPTSRYTASSPVL